MYSCGSYSGKLWMGMMYIAHQVYCAFSVSEYWTWDTWIHIRFSIEWCHSQSASLSSFRQVEDPVASLCANSYMSFYSIDKTQWWLRVSSAAFTGHLAPEADFRISPLTVALLNWLLQSSVHSSVYLYSVHAQTIYIHIYILHSTESIHEQLNIYCILYAPNKYVISFWRSCYQSFKVKRYKVHNSIIFYLYQHRNVLNYARLINV